MKRVFLLALISTLNLRGQFCNLFVHGAMRSFGVQEKTADVIRDEILSASGLSTGTRFIVMFPVDHPDVKQTAVSESCRKPEGLQGYVFYDPVWLSGLKTPQGKDWPKYFVLAHEIGHIQNGNTQNGGGGSELKKLELDADRWAVRQLMKMGAPLPDIIYGLDLLRHPVTSGYPTRCERLKAVVEAFNAEADQLNRLGAKIAKNEMCGECMVIDGVAGFYVRAKFVAAGQPLKFTQLSRCGTKSIGDGPTGNLELEVGGMCATKDLNQATRLTWENIGVCELIRR